MLHLFETIYLPKTWADLGVVFSSYISTSASVTSNCNVQKLFNIVTALISGEGAALLGSRVAGGMIFDLPIYFADYTTATS